MGRGLPPWRTHTHTGLRALRGFLFVRVVLGLLLLAAAGLKGYELWSNPLATDTRYLSTNWQIALIEAETLLGLWLLSGLWQYGSWITASVGFALLASVSLDLAVHKLPCGCLGSVGTRWELSAWHSFVVDMVAVVTLLFWRPAIQTQRASLRRVSWRRRLAYPSLLALVFVAGNAIGLFAVVAEATGSTDVVEELPPIFTDEDSRLIHTFTVKNDSSIAERICDICSCSKATLDHLEIQPAGVARLRVEAELAGKRGPQLFQSRLQLESGKTWTYSVRTMILERVSFDPRELNLGLVEPGQTIARAVELVFPSDPNRQIAILRPLRTAPDALKVFELGSQTDVALNTNIEKQTVLIQLLPQRLAGQHCGSVTARYSHNGLEHDAVLRATWHVKSYYELTVSRVFFRKSSQSAEHLVRTVTINRLDGAPLVIRGIRVTNPEVSCNARFNTPATKHDIQVTAKASESSTILADLIIETDFQTQPEIDIPVTIMNLGSLGQSKN